MTANPIRPLAGRLIRRTIATVRRASGLSARERSRLDGSRAAILMYHRIVTREQARREHVEPGIFVEPKTFQQHVDTLRALFRVLPLQEIVERLSRGASLPRGACAITFDDGWHDNLEHALPILEEAGLPATIFAVSERVGTPSGFWTDEVARRFMPLDSAGRAELVRGLGIATGTPSLENFLDHLKRVSEYERPALLERIRATTSDSSAPTRSLLDWDELARASRSGVDIEVHGASHAILPGLPADAVRRELGEALSTMRERGHARHSLLAYPSGAVDQVVVKIAREVGYAAAFTTRRGLATADGEPLLLPRIGLHDDISRSRSELLRWVPGADSASAAEAP